MGPIDDITDCAPRLRALADPTRLQLVTCLLEGSQTVSELCDATNLSMVKVSHHLQILRELEVVDCQRQGQNSVYSLCRDVAPHDAKSRALGRIDLGCCCLDLCESQNDKSKYGKRPDPYRN